MWKVKTQQDSFESEKKKKVGPVKFLLIRITYSYKW